MNLLTHIEWQSPWWLLALLMIPYLLWNSRGRTFNSYSGFLYYPDVSILGESRNFRTNIYRYSPALLYLALASIILALARPQYILRQEKVEAEGIDIFLVMDLSSSMLSQDFDPNRLEVSKSVAVDFISKRSYDRIGLVGFAAEGFTQCPLTVDHRVLDNLLKQMDCGRLEDGTAIGMGLSCAINRLKDDSLTKSKVIILLTDGVNNAGDIAPDMAAEMARLYNIKIYTIGVGSNGDAYSPVGKNMNGDYVFGMAPVNIDEALLSQLSQRTGGKYYRATNPEQLKEIYKEIDRLEKTKLTVQVFRRYSEEFRWLAALAWISVLLFAVVRIWLNPLMP